MKILLLFIVTAIPAFADQALINGEVVPVKEMPHIVDLKIGNSGCTGTVVGRRAIITAAHCAATGSTATFSIDGVKYQAKMTRSALYRSEDHDVCLGLVSSDVKVKPAKVTASLDSAKKGLEITIYGYGCTKPQGGQWDGKLRKGNAKITGFTGNHDIISKGAALCFGDSGGPAYLGDSLISINSKGNISTTNFTTRLDIEESQDFIKKWAVKNQTQVCGVTESCKEKVPASFRMEGKTVGVKVSLRDSEKLEDIKAVLNAVIESLDKR